MNSNVPLVSDSAAAIGANLVAPTPPRAQGMDQTTALNTIVSFLNIAQKRGVFTFEESAKIWECLKAFGAK